MKKKALLILGGSNDQLFLIKTANEMNIETVVVDGNENAIGFKFATYSKHIDFSNTNKVIEYCEQLINNGINLSGVLTMGSDVPHILAKIYSKYGITSNAISPGLIVTDMSENELNTDAGKEKVKNIPLGRLGTKKEISNIALFLASDEASYITGQTINANGGMYFG
jgi:hypothetical protein